ncbi:hypothetical protein F4777DRAFT_542663 [Nemania sp. FL0916]|nr:hypothetical protein F4777DRAFT_542663 [Nemania sp. FL0916]
MDSKASRYQSRILREMRNNADNPFSPPSSTGSHGTVTLTSQLSIPDGESTRQPMLPVLNTSVLGRTFPEWKSHGKENRPPSPELANDTASIFGPDSPRLRTHYQAPAVEETMDLPQLNPPRGNLTTLLDTLKTARSEKVQPAKQSEKRSPQTSPKAQPTSGFAANAARRLSRQSHFDSRITMSPSMVNQTAHSIFLPNLNHLNDFVSGTLRWSSMKNGTPIFVKHGRVYDRETRTSLDHHADFEVVAIPDEEEEIFVSLDKIREEIQTLRDHDELVSRQAEQLQEEVSELQAYVAKLKSRRDSALGSDADSSIIGQLATRNSQLEEQISSLQTRLDQANRKIKINEIHTQSAVAERDEALERVSDHVTTIKRLQTRNDAITQQKLDLQLQNGILEDKVAQLQQEIDDLINNAPDAPEPQLESDQGNQDALEPQLDSDQEDEDALEPEPDSDQENMTSALFIDDVTIDLDKKFGRTRKGKSVPAVRVLSPVLSEPSIQVEQTATTTQKENIPRPALTQSAKRVLNDLCQDHECFNCMVCARIQSHLCGPNGQYRKKTVRVERPVPVTDREKTHTSTSVHNYEDQPTLRPSQDPAIALAKVMKGLKDEEKHIRAAIVKKQATYDKCDASTNKRLWKQLGADIKLLQKRRDLKRDQIYDLHDVLEGQKANAQLMSQEAVDMTITSVLGKDPTWDGIIDF